MSNSDCKICRICLNLKINEKFEPLQGSLKTMLGIIIPNLKLEFTNNPVMCKECLSYIQKAFEYKTNFFEVEEIIETKKEKCNINNPSLSDLMRGKQYRKSSNINYCRTCLVEVKSQSYIDMKKTQGKWKDLPLLENCLFEMDSNLTSDCKVCRMCLDKLEEMYKFKINSVKTEERIIAYLKENSLDSDLKLNLCDILSIGKELNNETEVLPEVKKEKLNLLDVVSIKKEPNNETEILPEVKKECVENICNNNYDNTQIKKEKDELNIYLNSLEAEFKNHANNDEVVDYNYEEYSKKDSSGKHIYCCPLNNCSVVSRYKYNIKRHVKEVHKIKTRQTNKLFKCTNCEFTSSTITYVETIKHQLSHANSDIYKCTKCSYTNDKKTELIRHIFSHITDKALKEYQTLDH